MMIFCEDFSNIFFKDFKSQKDQLINRSSKDNPINDKKKIKKQFKIP
jgi:hypothetical protein